MPRFFGIIKTGSISPPQAKKFWGVFKAKTRKTLKNRPPESPNLASKKYNNKSRKNLPKFFEIIRAEKKLPKFSDPKILKGGFYYYMPGTVF